MKNKSINFTFNQIAFDCHLWYKRQENSVVFIRQVGLTFVSEASVMASLLHMNQRKSRYHVISVYVESCPSRFI